MKQLLITLAAILVFPVLILPPCANAASPKARAMAKSLMASPAPGLRAKRYPLRAIKRRHNLRRHLYGVDIDAINFRFGSAVVDRSQYWKLTDIADAMRIILRRGWPEMFLIEGHTDAVGSFTANQRLSERRARSVMRVLVRHYGLPRRAMSTAGYGERYLKINTPYEERRNRRVTIRRVSDILYRPAPMPRSRTYFRGRAMY